MALRRFTVSVDGTIPIPALLYNDECLLASQDGVGIYDGPQKATNHQSGAVHVSSHRLFFVHSLQPISHSFSLDLAHIMRTDYYAGLFMSSSKVTLYLDSTFVPLFDSQDGDGLESWVCDVCNHRNPPGLSPAAARVCALCGVPRSTLSSSPTPNASALATSRPASSVFLPVALSTTSRSSTPPPAARELTPVACTACTFLNHASLRSCEMCSTALPPVPGSGGTNSKSTPTSRPVSPPAEDDVSDPAHPLIKLSFRKGGDRAFYAILRRGLKARAWEGRQIGKGLRSGVSSLGAVSPDATPGPLRRSGIDGILRDVATSAQNTETELSDALQDLEALMEKAQELVHLAAELNAKLGAPAGSTTSEPEEATFIRSSLAQLGLQLANAPVTADMMQDERTWTEELARELAGVLQGSWDDGSGPRPGLMREGGIIGLDEVWGGWNRARGVALIPPATFLQTLQHLPSHTLPPIRSRVFPSGLRVLHTPPYTHTAFAARLSGYLAISGARTTREIAGEERVSSALAAELILAVEADGVVCRDGGGAEVRWSLNTFAQYIWDGCM